MDNNTLAHWGIKGMKWGVRRYQNADGSLTPAGKKRYGDYDGGDSRDSLSDDELRRRTARLRAENDYMRAQNDYAQLTAKKKSAGRKFVEDVLLNSGKQVATNYVTKLASSGIDRMLNGNKGDPISEALKKMSDADLKAKVARGAMEQQYRKYFG